MTTSASQMPAPPRAPADSSLPETMSGWRARLLKLGQRRAVALITVGSIGVSVILTAVLSLLLGQAGSLVMNLLIAFGVPLFVAPLVSHSTFRLLFEVEEARARLHQAAIRDGLTHAYNRRFFMARLEEELPRARRSGLPLSVLMIDVDHFKSINDSHGHAAGDAVLEHLARVLIQSLRPYDLVARYGGEEFVALMPGVSLAEAGAAAERVRAAIQAMQVTWAHGEGTKASPVTASLGCSCLGDERDTPATLLDRADRAMYTAKRSGRNRCVALAPELAIEPVSA